MSRLHLLAAAAAAACLSGAALAAGTVQVKFVEPDRYTDARDAHLRADQNLEALKRHLEQAAAPYVADGQTLKIDVLDVDLAGDVRHGGRAPNDVRVLRGRADWPRIELRYALEAPGQAARSGQARIQDLAYQQRLAGRSGEALAYERRMLDEWFRREFAAAK
jgi:Protein of unknown function (DUF3016)